MVCRSEALPRRTVRIAVLLFLSLFGDFSPALVQNQIAPAALYEHLHTVQLSGEAVHAEHLAMSRDRMALEWTGDFYVTAPITGRVYGAVFLGRGHLAVEPTSTFEKDSVRRFLHSDRVDAEFTAAVLRFTDDTYALIANLPHSSRSVPAKAQKLWSELDSHLLHNDGFNLSARMACALANEDDPGIFFAEFSGGDHDRFAALLDHQTRSIGSVFGINGGEKGMLFQGRGESRTSDIWTAFYDQQDYQSGRVYYASHFDLVDIPDYRMEIDLREAGHWMRATMELDLVALRDGVQFIPMALNEDLPIDDKGRQRKGTHVTSASLSDDTPVMVIQDPLEIGVSIILPQALNKGQKTTVRLHAEAEHAFFDWEDAFHYPLSTESWYPRHGYLRRSRFDLKFLHKPKTLVISGGELLAERHDENSKEMLTEWRSQDPLPLVSFAVGPFERHSGSVEVNYRRIPLDFYSAPARYGAIKEDFVLAELGNAVKFFSKMFGDYPYRRLGAAYLPSDFGQGFPTMLLLPVEGRSSLRDFAFIAHEVSHQWWGGLVAWQSYRDQWLSEGFAQYSAALYASSRENPKKALELVKDMRQVLQYPPKTDLGVAGGKLYEVGPLIMGHRLSSRLTLGGYNALIYEKGALTLRMLHFLFTDPASGNDDAFYQMMREFVQANRGKAATTEQFFAGASAYFVQTPIARKYGLKDLNWFLQQWVYRAEIPSYRLEYDVAPRPQGGVTLIGTIYQQNVPADWFMPLPVTFEFADKKQAHALIYAQGSQTPVNISLPQEPKKVLVDPDLWVLTERVSESRMKR